MLRSKAVEQTLKDTRKYFKEQDKPYDPNIVWGSDVLDCLAPWLEATIQPQGELTPSERETVIFLLNREFKWKIKLKHPKAYYLNHEEDGGSIKVLGDMNIDGVQGLILDINNQIEDFGAETIGEQKYIIIKLEQLIKTLKYNLKQNILFAVDRRNNKIR